MVRRRPTLRALMDVGVAALQDQHVCDAQLSVEGRDGGNAHS